MKILSKSPDFICPAEISGISFCKGTPSTTHKGSAFPVNVFVPRMRILEEAPGRPEVANTLTPAICPCNKLSTDETGRFSKTSFFIIPTDPVERRFVVCVYPVTTTSSNSSALGFNTTSNGIVFPFRFTSNVSIPTNEINNKSFPSGTFKLKLPSISVETPIDVPFISTVTPGNDSLRSSLTFPLISLNLFSLLTCGAFSNKIIRSWIR